MAASVWFPELVELASMTHEELRVFDRSMFARDASVTYTELFEISADNKPTPWPTATAEPCRDPACGRTYSTFPLGLVTHWNSYTHKLVLRGYFCSIACTLDYGTRHPHRPGGRSVEMTRRFFKQAFNLHATKATPPPEARQAGIVADTFSHTDYCFDGLPLESMTRERERFVTRPLVDPLGAVSAAEQLPAASARPTPHQHPVETIVYSAANAQCVKMANVKSFFK